MIVKDKTSPVADSRTAQAGDAAERQMAFYLRRRYAEDPKVRVFNDLRVERAGEWAQIDHLVLHRHGLVIIESKSVTGEVHINAQLEFTRVQGRRREGMASPIQQGKRQGDLLRDLFTDHKEELRNKALLGLLQGGFSYCPVQVLVAISDKGIIERPAKEIPGLHKADQVVDQIDAIMARHRRGARLTSVPDGDWGMYSFHPDELDRITAFLLARHTPLIAAQRPTPPPRAPRARPEPRLAAPAPPTPITPPTPSSSPTPPTYVCTHCHSTSLEVRYAHSYYFKCLACDRNTPIKHTCRRCASPARTRKRGAQFTAVCQACGHDELFFRNGAAPDS